MNFEFDNNFFYDEHRSFILPGQTNGCWFVGFFFNNKN
jgi:hypothetical protein